MVRIGPVDIRATNCEKQDGSYFLHSRHTELDDDGNWQQDQSKIRRGIGYSSRHVQAITVDAVAAGNSDVPAFRDGMTGENQGKDDRDGVSAYDGSEGIECPFEDCVLIRDAIVEHDQAELGQCERWDV